MWRTWRLLRNAGAAPHGHISAHHEAHLAAVRIAKLREGSELMSDSGPVDRRRRTPDIGSKPRETLHNIGFLEQQLRIARELGDRPGEARTLLTMGSLYLSSGGGHRDTLDEARRSVECLDQAIRIFREVGDHHGEGQCLCFMCIAFASVDPDSRPASHVIDLARVSLRILRQFGDPSAELMQMFLAKWEAK